MSEAARPLSLVVISAGLSVPSSTRMLADRLAAATRDVLEARGHPVDVAVIEVKDYAHDVVDATLTHFAGERLQSAIDRLKTADGVIAVTPTFNLSYAGLFKSFIDVVDPGAFTGVPVLLAATGGTARHSLAIDYTLRPLFTYLKADIVPLSVFAAAEDFGSPTTSHDTTPLNTRTTQAATILATRILHPTPTLATPAPSPTTDATPPLPQARTQDDFTDFIPMTDLLRPSP
ncbi:NAD(P)H-dependent oxidoreductase [Actinocorallia sp. API 0066]|uniref:CE1759 family FMN reductase n=1 Tax=Actinocorallia sp. API 0066 TaxID=2896846 RepID=UPI001E3C8B9C|nr:CE1759 family FMN reductase [Actinocorallia sp. API 0066]MCD0450940.1 NAD(P)H-dependent oxidoreductase [Actinocorallia sp. API 0066]